MYNKIVIKNKRFNPFSVSTDVSTLISSSDMVALLDLRLI